MPLKLTSKDFADGDYLAPTHAVSADFGFGCDGRRNRGSAARPGRRRP
jgi:hypothetical protein